MTSVSMCRLVCCYWEKSFWRRALQIRSIILFPLLLLPFESALGGKISCPVQYLKPIGYYPDGSIVYQMEMTTVLIEESVVVQANECAPGSPPALIRVVSSNVTDGTDTKYSCTGCSKGFTTYQRLQLHRKSASEPNCRGKLAIQCTGCNRAFDSNNQLYSHQQQATTPVCRGKITTKCVGCGRDFDCKKNLSLHRRKATEEKCKGKTNTKCSGCNTVFTSYMALLSHRYKTINEKCRGRLPAQCSGCGESFTNYNQLRNHWYTTKTKNPACQSTRKLNRLKKKPETQLINIHNIYKS